MPPGQVAEAIVPNRHADGRSFFVVGGRLASNYEFVDGSMLDRDDPTLRANAAERLARSRIVVITNGKIIEHGNHDDLMKLGGRYAHLFELQAAGYRE